MPDSVPGHATETVNFLIGFLVSVAASIMNAAGLNLLKLDHEKNSSKPSSLQRNECGRPLWHIGLYLYVASQMVGSTIALNFLKAQWVAPLGSVSLIFNFIFARILVGTKITRKDIIGTFVVILSVIWIVIFGGVNTGNNDEERKQRDNFFKGIDSLQLQKAIGMTMAGVGGLIASQTLLLAKSGVKLFSISITGINQFTDNLSWFILVGLAVTAVLQVYCLNTALKLHDSVLVVPMFYGFYTAMGLVNTMIYLDEISTYPLWALLLVTLGIGSLVYGVLLLSASKEEEQPSMDSMDFEIDEDEEMREENMLSTKAWDTGSTSGVSSSGGSYVGMLNRDETANNRSGGGKKKFGDGRFFSISKRLSNSKPGLFRMSLLKKEKHKLRNTKDFQNESDMNNYTTPHIIIDDESISDDEDYIQEQQATTPPIASPATAATTYDLMLFSPTSTNINSSTATIQPISSTTNNFIPSPRHKFVNNVYE
ncbi:2501_t:CDS:2, partial [Funneliformis geosporum]